MTFYDFCLLLSLPFIKKKRHHYRRLFEQPPNPHGRPVIWLHGVSVGEIKAAHSLLKELSQLYKEAFFLVTTTTEAGMQEAQRRLSFVSAVAYLPWDLSWIVTRWIAGLRPSLFLLMETDIWPQLMREVKKKGGKIALISGKLSLRSAKRLSWFPRFAYRYFEPFDLFCIQNREYAERLTPFIKEKKAQITGNIKFDYEPEVVDIELWRSKLGSSEYLTLSCTHHPEEEVLLEKLFDEPISFFLAPRHPDRFDQVADMLRRKKIPFVRFSQLERAAREQSRPFKAELAELSEDLWQGTCHPIPERRNSSVHGGVSQTGAKPERVILVDALGKLPICYSLSRLAILGGSFIPGIGGHNILEPCFYGIPVFFGPHMFGQRELVEKVAETKAGLQVSLDLLKSEVRKFLTNPLYEQNMKNAACLAAESGRGVVKKTLQHLKGSGCLEAIEKTNVCV